jgi:hypothetical protein
MRGRYTVAVYLQDRAYGGPEEGGWWYDTGELVRTCRLFRDEDKAYAYCRRMNDLIRVLVNTGRPGVGSVLSEGVYGAEVHEGNAMQGYPETRPHYE